MKKVYLITIALLSYILVNARQLTPSEALDRIKTNVTTAQTLSRTISQMPDITITAANDSSINAVYIFNTKSGYMIVSADDAASPLLGYSDQGNIYSTDIPPQLQYWLDFYASEIEWAVRNNIRYNESASSRSSFTPIEPLIKTKWNQSDPYNKSCPLFSNTPSVTGCVATAMAQILNYHQWPQKAKGGTLTYNSNYASGYEKTISMNFDNISFDWNNIINNYNTGSYTSINAQAVANLMYACGVSVRTNYSPNESSAASIYISNALYKYFDYGQSVQLIQRSFYTATQWEQIIYNQLENKLPVLYSGVSSGKGHAFICDGYSGDGFFHINWGWGGLSDGFYKLSALSPESQGIGGSALGYNSMQEVCINIAKDGVLNDAEFPKNLIYCRNFITDAFKDKDYTSGVSQQVKLGDYVLFAPTIESGFYNYACTNFIGQIGILLTSASGNKTEIYYRNNINIASAELIYNISIQLPSSLSNGTYTVTPIFKPSGSSKYFDILCPLASVQSLNLTVNGNNAIFTIGNAPNISVTDISVTDIYIDTYFSLNFTLENLSSTSYYSEIGAALFRNGNLIASTEALTPVNLNAKEHGEYNLKAQFYNSTSNSTLEPGTYDLCLFDSETGYIINYYNPKKVVVKAKPGNPVISISDFKIIYGDNNAIDANNLIFTGTISCQEGYFADRLRLYVFPESGGYNLDSSVSDYIFVNAGEKTTFSISMNFENAQIGSKYIAIVYHNNHRLENTQIVFKVTTDIDEIYASQSSDLKIYPIPANDYINIESGSTIKSIKIISMSGHTGKELSGFNQTQASVNVSDLPKGHYLMIVTNQNGNSETRHIIIQ